MIRLRRLEADDADLAEVAAELNDSEWEDFDNKFTAESLAQFLADERHIYLVAYHGEVLAGASHAYMMTHPAGQLVMYIDEVDTRRSQRRKGVARAMMQELLRLSREAGATEAWVGTEEGNEPAKALYNSLDPYEVETPDVIFSYKTK